MSLSPALSVGSYTHQYHSQGYLIYQHQGQAGKVCADSLNSSLDQQQSETFIRSLASTTCSHLQYNEMSWAAVTRDEEEAEVQYVGVSLRVRESSGTFTNCLSSDLSTGVRRHLSLSELPQQAGPEDGVRGPPVRPEACCHPGGGGGEG